MQCNIRHLVNLAAKVSFGSILLAPPAQKEAKICCESIMQPRGGMTFAGSGESADRGLSYGLLINFALFSCFDRAMPESAVRVRSWAPCTAGSTRRHTRPTWSWSVPAPVDTLPRSRPPSWAWRWVVGRVCVCGRQRRRICVTAHEIFAFDWGETLFCANIISIQHKIAR